MISAIATAQEFGFGLFGQPVTLYHRCSLQTSAGAQRVRVLLADATAAGETEISCRASGTPALRGEVPAGLLISIGDLGDFQTAVAEKFSLARPSEVVYLTLSDPLPANLPEGTVIELADAAEISYVRVPISKQRFFGSQIVQAKVSASLEGDQVPPIGALLDGEEIFEVKPFGAASNRWRVYAGEIRA